MINHRISGPTTSMYGNSNLEEYTGYDIWRIWEDRGWQRESLMLEDVWWFCKVRLWKTSVDLASYQFKSYFYRGIKLTSTLAPELKDMRTIRYRLQRGIRRAEVASVMSWDFFQNWSFGCDMVRRLIWCPQQIYGLQTAWLNILRM